MLSAANSFVLLAADGGKANAMKFAPDLATVTLIVFSILCIILYKVAWKPILQGLNDREKSIADQIDQAKTDAEKSQSLLAEYEDKLAKAADEANAILAEAKVEGQKAREKIVAAANEEAQRQKDRAIADIEAAKDQAIRDLAQKSVDSAVSLAGNLIKKEVSADSHSQLIQQSLENFAGNSSNN